MKILSWIFLLGINFSLFSQFTGGIGDGYASTEQNIISTGLWKTEKQSFIYPNILKVGDQLYWEIDEVKELVFTDVIGKQVLIEVKGRGNIEMPNWLSVGTYSVIAITDKQLFRTSILVYE